MKSQSSTHRPAIAVVTLVCGCGGPSIELHVKPQQYCPGTPVHLDWKATGDVTLQISPPESGEVPVAASGEKVIPPGELVATPVKQIVFQVRRHGQPPLGPAVTVKPVASRPFVAEVVACDVRFATTGPVTFGTDDYDPRARVLTISSNCHSADPGDPCPAITVCHGPNAEDPCAGPGSHSWEVAPDQPADLSRDAVDMAGSWRLARKLTPDERCPRAAGPAGSATPPASHKMTHLNVKLNLSCAPQGATP